MTGRPARPGFAAPRRAARRDWVWCAAVLAWLIQAAAPAAQNATNTGIAAPPPAAERAVSLQEAIQIAHQNHARITSAEQGVEAARQRVRQARTGTLPSVRGEVAYRGRGTSSFGGIFGPEPVSVLPPTTPGGAPRRVVVDTDSSTFDRGLQPRLSLTYNVYDGGLTRTQVRQARAGVDSSLANLGATRNNQAFEVTVNYLLQLRAERLLELRRVQERLAAEQLRSVEARIAAGDAANADRALPLSELRNRQVDLLVAQNEVRVAANALRNAMGLPAGPPLQLVEMAESRDAPPALDALLDTARRQRPEVIQAEAQVRVAQDSVAIARINRKPRLDTQFDFNLNTNNQFQRSDFFVGAGLAMPLWDAGLTHAREQEARSGVSAAAAQLEQVKKDVSADVVEAYLNLVNARERVEATRLALESAQVNLESTTTRYERGIANLTVVELIQAQVQFATASNNAIGALYDTYLAQAQLNRAIGR